MIRNAYGVAGIGDANAPARVRGGQLERHNFSSQSMRLSDKEIVRNPKKFFPGGS